MPLQVKRKEIRGKGGDNGEKAKEVQIDEKSCEVRWLSIDWLVSIGYGTRQDYGIAGAGSDVDTRRYAGGADREGMIDFFF